MIWKKGSGNQNSGFHFRILIERNSGTRSGKLPDHVQETVKQFKTLLNKVFFGIKKNVYLVYVILTYIRND